MASILSRPQCVKNLIWAKCSIRRPQGHLGLSTWQRTYKWYAIAIRSVVSMTHRWRTCWRNNENIGVEVNDIVRFVILPISVLSIHQLPIGYQIHDLSMLPSSYGDTREGESNNQTFAKSKLLQTEQLVWANPRWPYLRVAELVNTIKLNTCLIYV